MATGNTDAAIFLIRDSGELEKVPIQPYDNEDLLQTLIEKYPELLAGDQINPDEPIRWILVKREAGVPDGEQQTDRWSVDHLLLDQNGTPTFVETKRSSDTRIRREVVGQMLDYAANAQKYWPTDRIRSMTAIQHGDGDSSDVAIMKLLGNESTGDSSDIESYWAKVEENLHNGHVRLIFVADSLPAELKRVIEFLNDQMEKAEVLGIELTQYIGSNIKALVPRVIGQTETIRQKKQQAGPSKKHITEQEFLNNCPSELRQFFKQGIAESQHRGMQVYWGTVGFSLRAKDITDKPVSVFYGFPSVGSVLDSAIIQGYVGNITDTMSRDRARQLFLSIPGTIESGQYTVTMELNMKTIENARKFLAKVWDISDELSKKNST